jgi:uncharacterized protein (DUF362 family)
MSVTCVGLVRCHDYDPGRVEQAIDRQFTLLGGIERFVKSGDRVLLKPNFIAPRSPQQSPAQTHPEVIVAVARRMKDFGAKPFVADSPAWSDAATCARVLGLTEPLARLGVPILELRGSRKCRVGPDRTRITISPTALEADVIINLPKFKAHQQLLTTFAVKNMFGCVSGKRKPLWHFRRGGSATDFCSLLIHIYRHLHPALTIIDAIVAMDGPGPIRGRGKPLGRLIAGIDPIACETVCCRLIGLEPDQVPMIATAREIGWGCSDLDRITILGDPLSETPCADFELPVLIPIKFSLSRVCCSIARQILLLAGRSKNV